MIKEEGLDLKRLIQEFLNDDMGNRLTKWNSNAFAQTCAVTIDKIVAKDLKEKEEKEEKEKEIKELVEKKDKEIEELKSRLFKYECDNKESDKDSKKEVSEDSMKKIIEIKDKDKKSSGKKEKS